MPFSTNHKIQIVDASGDPCDDNDGRLKILLEAADLNIGNVDILSVPAPLNVVGAGTEATALRVTLANNSSGVITVDGEVTVTGLLADSHNVTIDNAQGDAAYIRIADGTNTMPTMDAVGRAGFTKITDGTNTMPTMDISGRAGYVTVTNPTSVFDGAITAADNAIVILGAKANAKSAATDATAITMMQVLKQISASVQEIDSGQLETNHTVDLGTNNDIKIASGQVESGAFASGSIASGAIAAGAVAAGAVVSGAVLSGAFASGSIASGALASGSIASGAIASGAVASGAIVSGAAVDGAIVTLGTKADDKSAATDTTSVTAMSVLKQISASVQIIDDWDDSNYANVNLNVAGTDVDGNSGNKSAQSQRVVIATDDVNVSAIKTAVAIPTGMVSGHNITISSSTAEQLDGTTDSSLDQACKRIDLITDGDNTGYIWVGDSGVLANGSGGGIKLGAGDFYSIDISNLSSIWLIATVNAENIRYNYFT